MKYGKIRIEDGNFIFAKHMMMNYLPCKDILWAYKRKEGVEGGAQKQFSTSSLVIITRRKKRYQFDLTDREIQDCIQLLKALNPNIVTGFPKGGRIPLQSLPNTRDLGALMTSDGRHILPHRLLRSGTLYHISIADQDTLMKDYHLTTVIDFRTKSEVLEKPDIVMEGVQYCDIPIVDEETTGITRSGRLDEIIKSFCTEPVCFTGTRCLQRQTVCAFSGCIASSGRGGSIVALQHRQRPCRCGNGASSMYTGGSERDNI